MVDSLRALASAVMLVSCALLSACASQQKKAEAELTELVAWLPGRYDNQEQIEEYARSGRTSHVGISLTIVPIYLPTFGEHVFYMQENALDDARRITLQRLLSFKATEDGHIVETLYTLNQPGRWRDGHLNADLFKGMMYNDATPMAGCDVLWKKDDMKFVGANPTGGCRTTIQSLGGGVRLELKAELEQASLSLAELAFNGSGQVVQGDTAEPFYRYLKRSGF